MKEKRKPGRPPVSQQIADYIMELARDDLTLTAIEVGNKAKKELIDRQTSAQDRQWMQSKFPSDRKVQDLVSKARNFERDEDALDAPWSMACLDSSSPLRIEIATSDRVLLAHSAGRLLEIYRRCLIVGQRFTVRQAIWAARLAAALPKADFSPLHSWAYMYASREKTALALGQPMDTSDLDANLAFIDMPEAYGASGTVRRLDNWEYQDAILAGYAKRHVTLSREEQLSAKDASSAQAEERRHGLMTWHYHGTLAWVEQEELRIIPVTPLAEDAFNAAFGPVPSEWKPKINKDNALVLSAANVTALWLRRIAETPKWRAMSSQDQRNTAVQLETLVKKDAEGHASGRLKDKDGVQNIIEFLQLLGEFGLDPMPGWLDRFARKDAEKRTSEKGERHDQTR